jgi:hypothetical protein
MSGGIDPAWRSRVFGATTFNTFMNIKIDIKSASIGLGIGVLVMLGIAAASSPGSIGRYQVAGTANHAVIIDTATGQAWSTFLMTSGGRTDGDFYQPKTGEKK